MTSPDTDTDADIDIGETTGVTVRCQDNPAVGLKFSDGFRFDEDCVPPRDVPGAW
jgi:hypothetical protein